MTQENIPFAEPASDSAPVAHVSAPPLPRASPASDRIWSIDVVRGVAVLGILLLNIVSFSMPFAAYMNPDVYGINDSIDRAVQVVIEVAGNMKFMSLFSILFGVGLLLQSDRNDRVGKATSVHLTRMGWLLLFGLIHAYGFWFGDILFGYAIAGLCVFWFRGMSARTLLGMGAGSYVACVLLLTSIGAMSLVPNIREEMRPDIDPTPEMIADEIQAYRGSWLEQSSYRAPEAFFLQMAGTFFYPLGNGGLMLIGMGLWKLGLFSSATASRRLLGVAMPLLALGYTLAILQQVGIATVRPDPVVRAVLWSNINMLAAPMIAIGYACLLLLACRVVSRKLLHPLESVGRTALSCYLAQTLICTTLFYGHGFGLYGSIDRTEALGICVVIWLVLLVVAPLWLMFFRFGPMEWLWRSLTYLRVQPLRRERSL